MNFSQMHERLRLELLRRIQRGTLSVSLLARQTGFGQSHLSNFLRCRRQLSLQALDRILAAQHIDAGDLVPASWRMAEASAGDEFSSIPIVSHHAALFEPFIRPSATVGMLHIPAPWISAMRTRVSSQRRTWQRFVAVNTSSADSLAMEPILSHHSFALIDRHYNSLVQYHPDHPNLYAVRYNSRLTLRYIDFALDRLILRPHNLARSVELINLDPSESPGDLIAGRIGLILNLV